MRTTALAITLVLGAPSCERANGERAVVVPVAHADAAAPVVVADAVAEARRAASHDECPGVGDALAEIVLPRGAPPYCADSAATKTYGEDAKYKLDDVCTTLLDGECEVYIRHRVRRVVSTRYVSRANALHSVGVTLSRFADAQGAHDMLAIRTSDGGFAPLASGRSAVLGGGVAYVASGVYFAELVFVTDDQGMTRADLLREGDPILRDLATRIEDRIRQSG